MLLPLFRKLTGAQPEQSLTLDITATPADGSVSLRMELKLDGQDLPPKKEAEIAGVLHGIWHNRCNTTEEV